MVLANMMHDAYCTFKVPALHQQVQRKESIALIYQNAGLPGSLVVIIQKTLVLEIPDHHVACAVTACEHRLRINRCRRIVTENGKKLTIISKSSKTKIPAILRLTKGFS